MLTMNTIRNCVFGVALPFTLLSAAQALPPEITRLDSIVPSPWQYTVQTKTGLIGSPEKMYEALYSVFFSLHTGQQSIKLYFYSSKDRDTIQSVLNATRMLSSCIPVRYDFTDSFIILSSPCNLNHGTAPFVSDSLFHSLDIALHTHFASFRFVPSCIDVSPSVFSGRPDPIFMFCNSSSVNLIRKRIAFYKEWAMLMSARWPFVLEGLGYRGLFVDSNDTYTGMWSVQIIYDGSLSSVARIPDPRAEFERMVIRAGIREKAYALAAYYLPFSEVIPDSLEKSEYRCGILTLQVLSDSMRIDFSLADTVTSLNPAGYHPWFPDLLLYHPIVQSNPGILAAQRLTEGDTGAVVQFDAMKAGTQITTTLPSDSIRSIINAILKDKEFSKLTGKTDPAKYIIKTSEGGTAFWYPVGYYIGGIDRLFFAYAYSTDDLTAAPVGIAHGYAITAGKLQKPKLDIKGSTRFSLSGRRYTIGKNSMKKTIANSISIDKSKKTVEIDR